MVRRANIIAWKRLGDRLVEIDRRQKRTLAGQGERAVDAGSPDAPLNASFPWEAPEGREATEEPPRWQGEGREPTGERGAVERGPGVLSRLGLAGDRAAKPAARRRE